MKGFLIKKYKCEFELIKSDLKFKGFKYKLKTNNSMKVKEINIINPLIINNLINFNFNKKYKKILELYLNYLQEDDNTSESGLITALDEIARLRSILIKKYSVYMNKKLEEKLLKKLKILENEIRTKIIDFKLIKEANLVNNNNIEEKSVTR